MTSSFVLIPSLAEPTNRLRLICLPHAGGGSAGYHTWKRELPDSIHVCPVQLPGRESRLREQPYTSLPLLVEHLTAEILACSDPCILFGHSLGALIAFELARRLQTSKRELQHLFVSASRAPHFPRRGSPLYQLNEEEFLAAVQTRYQPLPTTVLSDPELRQLVLIPLRADFTLFDTYSYQAGVQLTCPISVFGGTEDQGILAEDLAGWQQQTTHPCVIRQLPGDHFFLKKQQSFLLRCLQEDLRKKKNS